jgi:hypothetical protein
VQVCLLTPDVSSSAKDIAVDSESVDANGCCSFTGLTPGVRKLFAYGYYYGPSYDGSGTVQSMVHAFKSDVLTVKIKPGVNHLTVFLCNDM